MIVPFTVRVPERAPETLTGGLIHNNPCTPRWRLAEKPEDYKHSSASNYIIGNGIYDVELVY
ncbi:MAG: hypothetical protein IPI04_05385 [Ignavibacteria bacterium]|nr:hypothetical protein [Ignavibacteria bacterium]